MATLDRWRSYLSVPKTLYFPRFELMGRDHAPPIVVGTGEVRILSLTQSEYTLIGKPEDINYAFGEVRRQQQSPYDALARFRLVGTDADGVEWMLGWTTPRIEIDNGGPWRFYGDLEGLIPLDKGPSVSRESCTEVIYIVPVNHPMALAMNRFVRTDQDEGPSRREYVMEVLGSTIHFAYEPALGTLSITASHTPDLPATYAENWLGEPLRILFGQLVFPRLVARNLGDGQTIIFIRPSPGLIRDAGWAALWKGDEAATGKAEFWDLYAMLLTFVARAKDKAGHSNFEANKLTKLYEEIIQAALGSRWVWALTFASSIEGLVTMLIPSGQTRSDSDAKGIDELVGHINKWTGSAHLKGVAVNAVHRTAEITTIHALRELKKSGVITAEQLSAWTDIRNSVMHGSLVSPYSSEEEDGKLLALAAMVHALTNEILRRSFATAGVVAMPDEAARDPARDPQDLERLLVTREHAGDVEGMMALYEPQAVVDCGEGRLLQGTDAIRAYFAGVVATGRKFEFGEQRPAVISGDLALTSTRLPDGTVTAEVARRQADGTWLWVIDKFSNA